MENQPETISKTPVPQEKINKPNSKRLLIGLLLLLIVGGGAALFFTMNKQSVKTPGVSKKNPADYPAPRLKLPDNFDVALQNGPYTCPVTVALCRNQNNYKGSTFSATLTRNAPLYAAFDGTFETLIAMRPIQNQSKKEMFTLGILTSTQRGLQAYYYFNGETVLKADVKEGDKIATASGQVVSLYNKSFTFELIKMGTHGEVAKLSATDFK